MSVDLAEIGARIHPEAIVGAVGIRIRQQRVLRLSGFLLGHARVDIALVELLSFCIADDQPGGARRTAHVRERSAAEEALDIRRSPACLGRVIGRPRLRHGRRRSRESADNCGHDRRVFHRGVPRVFVRANGFRFTIQGSVEGRQKDTALMQVIGAVLNATGMM